MKNKEMEKIKEILSEAVINFKNGFGKEIKIDFVAEEKEEELILHCNIYYDRRLEYLLTCKRQNSVAKYMEMVQNDKKLDSETNPYKKLKVTDEAVILSNIYDLIHGLDVEQIICYKKFGMLLTNPLGLKGVYRISVDYITD